MPPNLLHRLFARGPDRRDGVRALYIRLIAIARQPHWFIDGGVADDINGRFAVLSSVVALTLSRLEGAPEESVALTELFVDDMDASMRELGIGDMVVGKRVGKLMGALGGRLGAYAAARRDNDAGAFREAVRRNVYGSDEVGDPALDHTAVALTRLAEGLARSGTDAVIAGRVPG